MSTPRRKGAGTRQYCTFLVDDLFFGVGVEEVQEVICFQEMTPVPLAPLVVQGLINLRGQIVTAINLRSRLALGPKPGEEPSMNVVVRCGDEVFSLIVDEIGDVVEVDDEAYEDVPPTLTGPARPLVSGTYKLRGKVMLVLDTSRAVEVGAVVESDAA